MKLLIYWIWKFLDIIQNSDGTLDFRRQDRSAARRKAMTLQTLADCGDDQFTTRVGNVAGFSGIGDAEVR